MPQTFILVYKQTFFSGLLKTIFSTVCLERGKVLSFVDYEMIIYQEGERLHVMYYPDTTLSFSSEGIYLSLDWEEQYCFVYGWQVNNINKIYGCEHSTTMFIQLV